MREAGSTRKEAARTVSVHPRTAQDWDQGIRNTKNGRLYPDGLHIDYTSWCEKHDHGHRQGQHTPSSELAVLEKPIDARFLSLQERESIRDLHASGASLRSIAVALGRSPSTISSELARNSQHEAGYQPYAAHRKAAAPPAPAQGPANS